MKTEISTEKSHNSAHPSVISVDWWSFYVIKGMRLWCMGNAADSKKTLTQDAIQDIARNESEDENLQYLVRKCHFQNVFRVYTEPQLISYPKLRLGPSCGSSKAHIGITLSFWLSVRPSVSHAGCVRTKSTGKITPQDLHLLDITFGRPWCRTIVTIFSFWSSGKLLKISIFNDNFSMTADRVAIKDNKIDWWLRISCDIYRLYCIQL